MFTQGKLEFRLRTVAFQRSVRIYGHDEEGSVYSRMTTLRMFLNELWVVHGHLFLWANNTSICLNIHFSGKIDCNSLKTALLWVQYCLFINNYLLNFHNFHPVILYGFDLIKKTYYECVQLTVKTFIRLRIVNLMVIAQHYIVIVWNYFLNIRLVII